MSERKQKHVYRCDLCGIKCKTRSKHEEHLSSYAHAKKAEGDEHWDLKFQSILCPECSIGFLNCKDFREHYNLKHPEKIDLQLNSKLDSNSIVQNIKKELEYVGDMLVICHLCKEEFREEKDLHIHVKTKHKRGRKRKRLMSDDDDESTTSDFDCKICHKSHGSQKKLKMHFQSYAHAKNAKDDPEEDTREQTINCTRCDEDFSNCKEFR